MIPDALRQSLPYRALRRIKQQLTGGPATAGEPVAPVSPSFFASPGCASVHVRTPEPYHILSNALYNESYFTLIDQCARGGGRHMTAEGLKNQVIENERTVYIRDDETGAFFSVGWFPAVRPCLAYRATAEPGRQTIENTTGDLQAVWQIFVPAGQDPVEIWDLEIADLAGRPRSLSIFAHVSMKCDGVDLYSGELFRIARYLPEQQAIFVRTDAEQHRTMDFPWHNGFMTSDRPPTSWDCNPGDFVGGGGRTLRDPQAVVQGHCSGSQMAMWPPVAALHWKASLSEKGRTRLRIVAGACDGAPMIEALKKRYCADAGPREADWLAVKHQIEHLTKDLALETPEPSIDGMLNVWVKLQCHFGLIWGRWGFCGFRDQLQQAIGCLTQSPALALARERILLACRHQYADGFALRGWRPIDAHRHVDSASWLIHAVAEFIKETGDFNLLEESAPYYDGGAGSVLEHLERAMNRLQEDRGSHGLPLCLGGDWNDSLTGPGRGGKGESVWMGMAFCRAAATLGELAIQIGRGDLAGRMREWRSAMAVAVNAHGWDGQWYLCALDDDGAPIGSAQNDEGKIFLNTQSWASLAGVATDERWASAWVAARKHLDTGWGFMLNRPAYTRPQDNVGRLSYIRPGAGENASVYTHGNAFLFLALLERGLADEALEVWRGINPANANRPGEAMPNVFYNGFYGPDSEIMAGHADHAWTTGSAAWMLFGVVELMLGARRTYDGLVIRPCFPAAWPSARLTRIYRGTKYRIGIDNPHAAAGAPVASIAIDGTNHPPERALPIDGKEHDVRVVLGKKPAP